jgi:hypothetical protein
LSSPPFRLFRFIPPPPLSSILLTMRCVGHMTAHVVVVLVVLSSMLFALAHGQSCVPFEGAPLTKHKCDPVVAWPNVLLMPGQTYEDVPSAPPPLNHHTTSTSLPPAHLNCSVGSLRRQTRRQASRPSYSESTCRRPVALPRCGWSAWATLFRAISTRPPVSPVRRPIFLSLSLHRFPLNVPASTPAPLDQHARSLPFGCTCACGHGLTRPSAVPERVRGRRGQVRRVSRSRRAPIDDAQLQCDQRGYWRPAISVYQLQQRIERRWYVSDGLVLCPCPGSTRHLTLGRTSWWPVQWCRTLKRIALTRPSSRRKMSIPPIPHHTAC